MPDISRLVIEIDSQGVLTANGNLEVFSRLGQKAGQTSDDMSKKFGAFMLIVNKLPGPLRSIASGLMGIVTPAQAAVSVFLELGEAAVNFAKESIQAFADFEMIKANLEVVMGSAQQAAVSFDEIRKMAGRTPFNVEQLASAAVQLKQTGTAANDLVTVLTMLGNTAGGSSDKFNRIVANFAQVQSVGKTTAMDLRQFAMMGIPIYDTLRQMGIEGNATADQVTEAFRRMTAEGGAFYNAMEKGAGTLQGKTTNLEGTWKSFLATFAETTGIGELYKKIIDETTEAINRETEALVANQNARNARNAIEAGEDTNQNYYNQYANELIDIENKIKRYEGMAGGTNTQIAMLDILYKKRKEIIALMKPYEDSVKSLEESEKSRVAVLQQQKDLIAVQVKSYDSALSSIHERYTSTQDGRMEALRKELETYQNEYRALLSLGRAEEQENLQEFGPGNRYEAPIKLIYRPATDTEKREYEAAIKAVEKEIQDMLEKTKTPLKDWQIELGKIFNFTPTVETRGLQTITNYINDLTTARNKLFSTYKDKTIADILGIAELDQAKKELADMQSNLRQMLEFRGSEEWTGDDKSIQTLIDKINQAQTVVNDLDYEEYIRGLDKELNLISLSTRERNKQQLLEKNRFLNEEKVLTVLEKQEMILARQSRYDTIRGILGTGGNNDIEDYMLYIAKIESAANRLDNLRRPEEFPMQAWEFEMDNGEIITHDFAAENRKFITDMGLDITQLYKDMEQELRNIIIDLYKAGESPANEYFSEIIKKYTSVKSMADSMTTVEKNNQAYEDLKEELELRLELLGLSEEEARIKELTIQLGDEARAKEIYALEQEIQKTEALKEALETLKEAGISLAATSLVDFAHDLGKAFQDGTVSSDEFSDAVRNMLRNLIDAMPQLLLNVGLQLISAGQWPVGLAFIGASGLMSFISGLVSDAEDSGRNDELEKLNRIQRQITDLIAAQKEQEEYYTVKRRQLTAQSSISVNDAIITPNGIVNTHPEDFIIATKHPETLMGGGAAPVNITIINNTPATVTQQEGVDEDGARQITVLIDQVVQNGLAGGKYDRAMGAMNRRAAGRHVVS
ncbi:MAG: tape measure protein [Treponema sp.]|jgi:hypothetical protein|nr:tape measure protein [Treponema sp.]